MKLVVFGATGGVGREVVRQALEVGHTVTAVVRDPAKLSAQAEVVHSDLSAPDLDVLPTRSAPPTPSSPQSGPPAARMLASPPAPPQRSPTRWRYRE
jgi:NAD(P)-dependent dehydrogenase (short-subunit alcohol dehydrogenase family)